MVVRAVGSALLAALVLSMACAGKAIEGDGDGGSSGGSTTRAPTQPSPVDQCKKYASTWCNKAFGCYVQVGRLEKGSLKYNVDQCVKLIEERLPCSDVATVTGDYDQCLAQIKAMACSRWNVPEEQFGTVTPPEICDVVLQF